MTSRRVPVPSLGVFAFGLGLGVAACAGPGDPAGALERGDRPIIGGETVATGVYPSVLALSDGNGLCTATLVHAEWVLTAAHCVDPILLERDSLAEVVAAAFVVLDDVDVTDQNGTGETLGAAEIYLHPDWNADALGDNDIALIKLEAPVTDRTPIPVRRTAVPAATPVVQVGFGVATTPERTGAGILRELSTETTSCAPFGAGDAPLLCFDADDGDGICFGDSGGPTFVGAPGAFEIAGVASFVANEDCTGFDAASDVARELAFLDEHLPAVVAEPDPEEPGDGGDDGGDGTGGGVGDGGAGGPSSDRAIAGGCSVAPPGGVPGAAVLVAFALAVDRLRRRRR